MIHSKQNKSPVTIPDKRQASKLLNADFKTTFFNFLKELKLKTTLRKLGKIIYEQNENIKKDLNYVKEPNKFWNRKVK